MILDTSPWHKTKTTILKPLILKLTLQYLLKEKHHGKPLDGVQKFHLSNGAELYNINFLADESRKGMHTSFGVMVNYRYRLEDIERNSVYFETDGVVRVGERVQRLMKDLDWK